ncbi:ISWI chromatin-remodeling complex ATPase ISW2 [Seminavis robusta]|uniref:ISWI chromatin-remodeling complex ATPase ISW2 n=1 Tax=Seminavis robusta TaxID=568900 RepID=A0A9N8E5E0_9STRA|nr:ISWI chromatin-remodeling complex ATPase ISW2 [Seminavis robusta]|eukprot:Sro566_g167850.1 ISWI chromatin-remodeling complex ATPase ISW2 (1480) ;mRNA; r:39944-45955
MVHVRKARTAFLFFQSEFQAKIKKQLGGSMGEAMTELSARWKRLSDEEREVYLEKERIDRARYEQEAAEADRIALIEQEERRKRVGLDDNDIAEGQKRGARQRNDDDRAEKDRRRKQRQQKIEAELDPEVIEERKRAKEQKKRETEERQRVRAEKEQAMAKQHAKLDKEQSKKSANRLEYLLNQSSIFGKLKMGGAAEKQKEEITNAKRDAKDRKKAEAHHRPAPEGEEEDALSEDEEDDKERHVFLTKQPNCIKFGKLKPYQVESLNWMIHLAEKGLNGILADEMGLGKTLQSISILAYHYEYLNIQGPHIICVPKSTLSNWMNELNRWCPALRAIKFHGSKEDREYMIENDFSQEAAAHDGKRPQKQVMNEKGELIDDNSDNPRTWDVCVTTYEMCNTERKLFQRFAWKYLVIDEAHRLKNDASMFSKTVRSFRTANRLLLTGTPLQNNLHELWALLNFLLPDIFSSSEQFDEWFDLEVDDEQAKKDMISQLHKVLRPFMLRRLKSEVAKGLPPKTETIIMVGMSRMQKQLYKKLLLRDIDSIVGQGSGKNRTAMLNIVMQLRKCCGHPYLFEGVEDRTLDPLGDHLVENCGKLSMVDKLLKRLKERGSRVLIFTQMTRILDILEDFMVMRGYQYCRIDGNTTYEVREESIDAFNAPNSPIFCFILSTRAGGLGINLQTADTCILYDSDWNPQQDLQAQDRCHRLGQKKPVNVYRLVSQNTIEEKIVERAQQKLKLDAMVVQQGRLKDKDNKISKDEMMAAVRFGADTVFRSEESTITDEDIDVILERGAAKTKELQQKLSKAEKGDLLDFRLDGGISSQEFEGVDYSDKALRDHLRMLAANSIGKRERKPPPTSYNPIIHTKKSMTINNQKVKLPKSLRLPPMEDHHFFNRERLIDLGKLEFETYATLRELGQLPPRDYVDRARTLLPPELGQEKIELLDEGFGSWTKTQYYHFVKAAAKYGRDDIAAIAADMDMQEEAVAAYSDAFWKYGPTELKSDWERVVASITKGEQKIAKQKKLTGLLSKFVSTFDDARNDMTFANKGTTHFALEQDRALLYAVDKHGYGNWDSVREEIKTDRRLMFQHTVQGMTTGMIVKRCDYRMRQMEKELEAREKVLKNQKPANVIAAQRAIEAIKEADGFDDRALAIELRGENFASLSPLSKDARQVEEERLKDRKVAVDRLRDIEVQLQRCKMVAEETKEAIHRGDQYVNYSNISLSVKGKNVAAEKAGVCSDLEERINQAVLRVPECGVCVYCTEKTSRRKLCRDRLDVREELIAAALKKEGLTDPNNNKAKPAAVNPKKRKAEPAQPTKKAPPKAAPKNPGPKKPLMIKQANGKLKQRVTSNGNKRMAIPDEVFPEFCRRIGAAGTGERNTLINQFVEDNPTISLRQVSIKMSEITTKDRPAWIPPPEKKGGRAFMFYLRPRHYKHLPPNERPEGWEVYAAEDERKFQEEQVKKKDDKKDIEEGPPKKKMKTE